jgi:ubiquinone/menaquinone biosynthesis C-methylase UbiE
VIPAIDGIRDALANGVKVADIGCGAGSAILLMGKHFPKSSFVGYDISQYALDRAADKLNASGVKNVSFHDPRKQPLPTDNSVDFISTFDCIHDMTHPAEMMHSIRAALKPNGTWLLVDIKAHDTFALNAQKNPMAPLMYGISVLSCMSSAMSSPDGAGLGTLGLSAGNAESMAKSAGFSQFRRLDIDHSINAFYEIRP